LANLGGSAHILSSCSPLELLSTLPASIPFCNIVYLPNFPEAPLLFKHVLNGVTGERFGRCVHALASRTNDEKHVFEIEQYARHQYS